MIHIKVDTQAQGFQKWKARAMEKFHMTEDEFNRCQELNRIRLEEAANGVPYNERTIDLPNEETKK